MPLGDSDLMSGVFFADFGLPVVFGTQTAMGNLDSPGKDSMFDSASVSNTEYRLEVAAVAFDPLPDTGDSISVGTVSYKVRSATPLDDGAIIELMLRKI